MKTIAILLLAAVVAYGGWKTLAHRSESKPALVPPAMNAHLEFSDDLVSRAYRAVAIPPSATKTTRPKLIALTFDDGPYPIFTPMLLDELRDLKVPATFFLIGRDAEQWPELTRRIEEDGHEIADHTYSHPNLDQETPAEVRAEVLQGRDVLWGLTHDPSVRTLMRPPHGRFTEETLRVVQSLGYSTVLWTDDGGDWRTLTPEEIGDQVIDHATAPDLVLLHSGKLATIEALPAIVDRFRKAGYTFVTVGQLLAHVSPDALNHPLRGPV
jgi:peptidoglycan/xylan/chitin deacetylase (PgdA/CDA1 family)